MSKLENKTSNKKNIACNNLTEEECNSNKNCIYNESLGCYKNCNNLTEEECNSNENCIYNESLGCYKKIVI